MKMVPCSLNRLSAAVVAKSKTRACALGETPEQLLEKLGLLRWTRGVLKDGVWLEVQVLLCWDVERAQLGIQESLPKVGDFGQDMFWVEVPLERLREAGLTRKVTLNVSGKSWEEELALGTCSHTWRVRLPGAREDEECLVEATCDLAGEWSWALQRDLVATGLVEHEGAVVLDADFLGALTWTSQLLPNSVLMTWYDIYWSGALPEQYRPCAQWVPLDSQGAAMVEAECGLVWDLSCGKPVLKWMVPSGRSWALHEAADFYEELIGRRLLC